VYVCVIQSIFLSIPWSLRAAFLPALKEQMLLEYFRVAYSEDQETFYSAIFLQHNTPPCILIEEWFA